MGCYSLQVIETLLFSTFVSWKAFFPLVRDEGDCTYTFITGAPPLHALCRRARGPIPYLNGAVRCFALVPQAGPGRSC